MKFVNKVQCFGANGFDTGNGEPVALAAGKTSLDRYNGYTRRKIRAFLFATIFILETKIMGCCYSLVRVIRNSLFTTIVILKLK